MKTECKWQNGLYWLLIIALAMFGGFYNWAATLIGVAVCVVWIWHIYRSGKILWYSELWVYMVIVYGIALLAAVITAVDIGEAFIGVVRFLPILIWLFLNMQYLEEERRCALYAIPHMGCVMVIVSLVSLLNEGFSEWFWAANRLGGFFQYSNTCAVFFLVGMIIIWDKKDIVGKILWGVLFLGILLTGSRTVMVLLLPVLCYFVYKGTKDERCFIGVSLLVAVLIAVVAVILGNFQNVARILTSFTSNSTFYGRLLYFKDAIGLIIEHPLGLGSYGYYYLQPEIQTGVYTTMYVHNDFLQAFLDGGWICGICLAIFTVIQLYKSQYKMCIAVILIHCLFDFDLQYPSMWMVLILLCSFSTEPKFIEIKKVFKPIAPFVALTVFFVYFTIPFAMEYLGNYKQAIVLYPKFTEAKCSLLLETDDADKAVELADNILASNPHISTAYDAKALAAYSKGDIEGFCTYKEKVLEIEKYDITQYEDYVWLLYAAASDAYDEGDMELMEYCIENAQSVPTKLLEDVKQNTSSLAYKIQDKPVFEITEPNIY